MEGGYLMSVRAREALAEAIRSTASAQERHVLVAALALRLAQLGHTKEVRVLVAGTVEACEAVRSFLADWRTGALQARDAPRRYEAGSNGSEAVRPRLTRQQAYSSVRGPVWRAAVASP
jgi:hypothetical protein